MEGIRSGSEATCRRPEDDHEAEAAANGARETSPGPRAQNHSETPKQACSLDKDWDAPLPHELHGPPAWGPLAPPPEPAPAAAPPPPPKEAPVPTGSNAARTSGRNAAVGPYASAGYSPDGHSVHAGVAVAKGLDPKSGAEVESASVSAQVGAQNEAQATALRIGTPGGTATVESMTANAHIGIHNSDGSTGINVGAGANYAAGEVTVSHSGYSATVGLSEGVGFDVSIGARDKDSDGRPEICVRQSAGPLTVGACIEFPIKL